jgi:hypothetical protein
MVIIIILDMSQPALTCRQLELTLETHEGEVSQSSSPSSTSNSETSGPSSPVSNNQTSGFFDVELSSESTKVADLNQ